MTGYDYVIIGAGSAGCVLAGRLSEDPTCRVLLLEAGGSDRSPNVWIPAAFPKLFKTERDWAYETEPADELGGRSVFCPRGKMLGGSSSMNAQMYVRGNRSDYDEWAALGNEGWAWDDVLPLFRRSETYPLGPTSHRGSTGPLHVQPLRDPSPLTLDALTAMQTHGIPATDDYNGPVQDGAGLTQVTQRRGRRWSAANAFLAPARKRANLDIVTGAHVTRLVVEGGGARAVQYRDAKGDHEVSARREIVLSGGAINSPQLLLLSGVGPADQLARFDIELQVDLPGVGANLQDHQSVPYIATLEKPISLLAAESPGEVAKFLFARKGMLTSNVGEAMAFIRIDADAPAPDMQLIFAPVEYINHGLEVPPGHGITLGSTLLCPRSRGEVRLASADPFDAPVIAAGYLTDPEGADLRRLVASVRLCREIAAVPALKQHLASEMWPGPSRTTDDELAEYVREQLFALYHPVGTCSMGVGTDAVVDPELRVRGVDRLRVIDASVMPIIPRGNTNAAAIMIGERGADLVRAAT